MYYSCNMQSILKTSRYTNSYDGSDDSQEDSKNCLRKFLDNLLSYFQPSENKYRHGPTSEESFCDRLDRLDSLSSNSMSSNCQRLIN
jgi:hypothetical protein